MRNTFGYNSASSYWFSNCPPPSPPPAGTTPPSLPPSFLPSFLTLETDGDAEVHHPADQGHEESQQDEEDPVLPDPRDQELLTANGTDWRVGRRTREQVRTTTPQSGTTTPRLRCGLSNHHTQQLKHVWNAERAEMETDVRCVNMMLLIDWSVLVKLPPHTADAPSSPEQEVRTRRDASVQLLLMANRWDTTLVRWRLRHHNSQWPSTRLDYTSVDLLWSCSTFHVPEILYRAEPKPKEPGFIREEESRIHFL